MAAQLTPEQQRLAEQLANSMDWHSLAASVASGRSGEPEHPLAQQTLSIEESVTKKSNSARNSARQVRVYQFDYHHAIARVVVVSLTKNAVVSETLIPSPHLPLNEVESAAALNWLGDDAQALARLRAEQIRRGQTPFTNLSELSVKASIYVPIDKQHECALERCALLSLIDDGNTVFAIEPLINLQRRTVGWLLP